MIVGVSINLATDRNRQTKGLDTWNVPKKMEDLIVGVSINWATDRNRQNKELDTWNVPKQMEDS